MLRKAVPDDEAALEAFLAAHATSSMFLRGNLAQHGTEVLHHRNGSLFLLREVAGAIVAVAGITNSGYLMCQAPDQEAPFWQEVCAQLQGRSIGGVTGDPAQTERWIAALGVITEDFAINEVTPLYQLDLADVAAVDPGLVLQRPGSADLEMLTDWYEGFHTATGLTLPEGSTNESIARGFIADPEGRLLFAGDVPVAMTKLNAKAVDTVQIGGVYVPPEQHGHGYGGDVVALHLAELAQQGLRRAILFAASEYAARAYERIGFQQVGAYRVAMFKMPVIVGAARAESGLVER